MEATVRLLGVIDVINLDSPLAALQLNYARVR